MAVLLEEEVDFNKIKERFVKVRDGFHKLELGYPDIGEKWTSKNENKIHPQDWKLITEKIKEKYEEFDYDLILISAHYSDWTGRFFNFFSDCYRLK